MTCSLIDIPCHIGAFFAPIIFWLKVGFGIAALLAVLAAFAWVYRRFGWWGVGIAASLGAAAVIFKKGAEYGARKNAPLPLPKPRKKKIVVPPDERPGTWNYREGRWNE